MTAKTPVQNFRVAIDSGNHDTKYITPGSQPTSIRAIKAQVAPGTGLQRHSPESPLVVSEGNRIIHMGRSAQRYSLVTPQVITDKLEASNVLDAVRACLGVINGQNTYTVDLAFSVPATDRIIEGKVVQDYLNGLLVKKHQYRHNGTDMTVTVRSVQVVREADAAWKQAQEAGLVPSEGDSLLVDFGGGTVNATLFEPDGYVIDALTLDGYGCVKLANMLAENSIIRSAVGAPELHILMDGIATGTNRYGRTPVDFKPALDEVVPQWFKLVMSTISAQLRDKMGYLEVVVLNGGSSLLLKDLVDGKPGTVFSPDPKYSVVKGLMSYL